MNEEKSIITRDQNKKIMGSYIFDEERVLKIKSFPQLKLDNSLFAYGLFLPREIPLRNSKGEEIGREQIWSPVLIPSNRQFIEVTREIESSHKIKFEVIPENLSLRWSLASIKGFLESDDSQPEISPLELFTKIFREYESHIYERESVWNKVNTLWDIGTYFFELFEVYPISEKRGLQETAKTKRMSLSSNLTFNSSPIMINPSEATLFRETHEKRPTKYFDEAEKLFRFNKGQLEPDNRVELINGSYSKGSTVPRVEKRGNRYVTVYYKCYSPTMISSIRGLFGATESRCITQICTRNPNSDDRGEKEINSKDPGWQILRDYLYVFGLTYFRQIEKLYQDDSIYADLNLKKRDLQIWRPLLSLAKLIGDDLFKEIVDFAGKLSSYRREDFISEDSLDYKILKIVRDLIIKSEIVRPKALREEFKRLYAEGTGADVPKEKYFSTRLDNFGFRELRETKDRDGAKYRISKDNFELIVAPICPDLVNNLSFSSQSSQTPINIKNSVTNNDEYNNSVTNKNKTCDENDEKNENDESFGIEVVKIENKIQEVKNKSD